MISVAAELVGMHPQTLHHLRVEGLVRPKRTPGNTRLYSEDDLERPAHPAPDHRACLNSPVSRRSSASRTSFRRRARGSSGSSASCAGHSQCASQYKREVVPPPRGRPISRKDEMDFNRLTTSREKRSPHRSLRDAAAEPRGLPEHLCIAPRPGASADARRARRRDGELASRRVRGKLAAEAGGGAPRSPHASTDFAQLLDRAEEEMRKLEDEYVSTEHLLLALDVAPRDKLLAALKDVRGSQRHVAGSRGLLPGAREVRPRSHRARRVRQARPGHRAGRGDCRVIQATLAPDEEQPRPHRRPGRRQDRDRRGPRPAHRRGRRPGRAQGPARSGRSTSASLRRLEVPCEFEERLKAVLENIKEAEERIVLFIDEPRSSARARPRHAVDAANMLKPMLARGELRCSRCDDSRRVPQAHREGRRARAPVPAGLRRRAFGRGHDRHPPRPEGALRGATASASATLRSSLLRAVLSDRYISDRQLPDKAIDLVDESASRLRMEIDSSPLSSTKPSAAFASSRSSSQRWARSRRTAASRSSAQLADAKSQWTSLVPAGRRRRALDRVKEITQGIDDLRMEAERAERQGDLQRVAEIRYGSCRPSRPSLAEREQAEFEPMVKEESTRTTSPRSSPAGPAFPSRASSKARPRSSSTWRSAPAACRRPGRGRRGRGQRAAPRAYRPPGSEPADRLFHLSRADRREDRARPRSPSSCSTTSGRSSASTCRSTRSGTRSRALSAPRPATSATTRAGS